jgi:hypothetical protein
MSLTYFIPGQSDARRESLEGRGMGHVFDAAPFPFGFVEVSRGPGDVAGLLVAVGSGKGLHGACESHTWHEGPGGALWVGIEGDIEPDGLQRREVIDGHLVTLEDGNQWLIPVARSVVRGPAFPSALILGPKGEVVRETLPRFREISVIAERVERMFFAQTEGDDSHDMDLDEGFAVAVAALAINYRIGPVEASALRLISDDSVRYILRALVDVPTMVEVTEARDDASKKNDHADTPDGPSSSDGSEG